MSLHRNGILHKRSERQGKLGVDDVGIHMLHGNNGNPAAPDKTYGHDEQGRQYGNGFISMIENFTDQGLIIFFYEPRQTP